MKVRIESITVNDKYHDNDEVTVVYVDNERLPFNGWYGGEPEDNLRSRNYSWVEPILRALAEKLGAEVEVKEAKMTDEEFYK